MDIFTTKSVISEFVRIFAVLLRLGNHALNKDFAKICGVLQFYN
jgi:hypothetical protein